MALIITEENGLVFVEGSINTETASMFQKHITNLFENNLEITINIEKVDYIDKSGLAVLKQFFKDFKNSKQSVVIVGYGCKEIYEEFRSDFAA